MLFGKITVSPLAIETHKDSYLLLNLSVVSVRRPFLSLGLISAIGGSAFALRFADLLHDHELALIASAVAFLLLLGFRFGQIQLLSHDLRGTELTGVIWGSYGRLNRIRREIVAAVEKARAEGDGASREGAARNGEVS